MITTNQQILFNKTLWRSKCAVSVKQKTVEPIGRSMYQLFAFRFIWTHRNDLHTYCDPTRGISRCILPIPSRNTLFHYEVILATCTKCRAYHTSAEHLLDSLNLSKEDIYSKILLVLGFHRVNGFGDFVRLRRRIKQQQIFFRHNNIERLVNRNKETIASMIN